MKIEVLKSKQKTIWPGLKAFKDFRLVGGTALALQMGHRMSVDFDLFSEKPLSARIYSQVKREFSGFLVSRLVNLADQLTVKVNDVKIDFVYDKFKFVQPVIRFQGIQVATIAEIAAMKAYTLSFRGSNKDYVDLYFILQEKHITLEQIGAMAEKRYGNEFNFRLFLEQLLYIEETRKEPIEFLKRDVSEAEAKKFFKKEIKKMVHL